VRIFSNWATVMIRFGVLTTFGRAVWVHGLTGATRSMTARLKILCSSAWYFTTERADRPFLLASLTQDWMTGGPIRRIGSAPRRTANSPSNLSARHDYRLLHKPPNPEMMISIEDRHFDGYRENDLDRMAHAILVTLPNSTAANHVCSVIDGFLAT
jgi:hypothetical protein